MKIYIAIRNMLPILLLVAGCSPDKIITIGLGDPSVERDAVVIFKKQGIWYKRISDGRYQFHKLDFNKVMSITKSVSEHLVPQDRSISFGPELQKIMIKNLKTKGVPFKLRKLNGDIWFIWDEKDYAEFISVENESKEELDKILKAELK